MSSPANAARDPIQKRAGASVHAGGRPCRLEGEVITTRVMRHPCRPALEQFQRRPMTRPIQGLSRAVARSGSKDSELGIPNKDRKGGVDATSARGITLYPKPVAGRAFEGLSLRVVAVLVSIEYRVDHVLP